MVEENACVYQGKMGTFRFPTFVTENNKWTAVASAKTLIYKDMMLRLIPLIKHYECWNYKKGIAVHV